VPPSLCSLHLWNDQNVIRCGPEQLAQADPSLNVVGVGLDDLQRSLPTSIILSFCKIIIGFISIKCNKCNISVSMEEYILKLSYTSTIWTFDFCRNPDN